ncbi:cupin domain-containing protein [Streptomyces turgidiscabies]|uniref:Cupin domain protein n=1 Tax=Streptomyces turgidiscabies (strain Car8) TaxID=698760 RepID=L7FH69_STRT8|nr:MULTISPECIES: cupin domain-containing protein [Streptomyces]ELP70421.1 cupin domain protein [Streptomyces turgidiscabies Car8]MDX3494373.1 cupin domain-containing protein [Streptomyces turgidiscabies]GAQ74652.1 quercetin 2,3-dioxygenase [Streptomyces turgidiscabies]
MQTTDLIKVAIDDVPPNRKRGGDLRVLLSPKTCGATSGFMGVGTLEPGEFVSEHYHEYSEEFFYAIRGRLLLRVDGRELVLEPGESFMVPIGVRHRIENPFDEQAFVSFFLSPLAPRPELGHVDCEPLPGEGTLPEVGGAV